jgi:DNA polymerase-1
MSDEPARQASSGISAQKARLESLAQAAPNPAPGPSLHRAAQAALNPAPQATVVPMLLLVDGSSYLYRAFHALPDMRSPQSEPTGAIYGMVAMLRKLRADRALHGGARFGAVVFDAPGKTFRDHIFPAYKANRSAMPPDLALQIPRIHQLVRWLGWPLVMVEGIEADDVIGTLTAQAKRCGWDSLVSTGDKDLAQLVDANTRLVNTMTRDGGRPELLDAAAVVAKFAVRPDQIIDYLSLVGDAVDNVPGVEKVGPKTAAKWLAQYENLDQLMAQAGQIGGVVGENLRQALGWLPTARDLVTVRRDCQLPSWCTPGDGLLLSEEQTEGLRELFKACGFRTWLRELEQHPVDPNAAKLDFGRPDPVAQDHTQDLLPQASARTSTPASPSIPFDRSAYETVLSEAALERWLADLMASDEAAVDTETTDLDPMRAVMVGISLAVAPNKACYVPLAHEGLEQPGQLDRAHVLSRLRPWLCSPKHKKLGQHIKYDMHVFENHGIRLEGIADDSLLASYVLEAHRSHDMDSLAERHLNHRTITYDDLTGKGATRIAFAQVPVERAAAYAAEDADVTYRLCTHFRARLAEEPALDAVYRQIEVPVMQVLQGIERHGVMVDTQKLRRQSEALEIQLADLEAQAHEAAQRNFNLGSPKQLGELLFQVLKLPVLKKTASGAPSTDEEVLAKLAEDYPLPRIVLQWRGLAKLKSTYTDKLPKMIHPVTGRVHTSYNQAVAVTGRLASTDPNLQNIPIRTAEGRRIREAFIAPPGFKILSADYSQIELRIMAHISADPGLLAAFARGDDVHRATAAEVFAVPVSEVSSEQRRYAKVINFGLIYGMSAFGLASNLGIDRQQAKHYIDRYFARYPGVLQYMERTRQQAREQGYVQTVFGRRLWLSEIQSPNGPRRQAAERAAINAPMQGTAADLIKMAMIRVADQMKVQSLQSRMIMQVHDELVFEVAQDEILALTTLVRDAMLNVAQLAVPLDVDVGVGDNWDEAH